MKKAINYKIIFGILLSFLLSCSLSFSQNKSITVIVESLPRNTPAEDPIFACGNFNDWKIDDPDYQLKQRSDGKLFVNIPQTKDTIQFKFSRGDWMKIETTADNAYLPNRILVGNIKSPVKVSIENWQDVGGQKSLPFYVLILSAAILNGIFLIVLLKSKRKKYDLQKTSKTITWSVFLIIALSGTVINDFSDPVWKFRLMLGFEVLLLIGGPLLYALYKTFFAKDASLPGFHFVPGLIVLLINVPRFFGLWESKWLQISLTSDLFLTDAIIISLGCLIFLGYILVFLFRLLNKNHNHRTENENRYVSSFSKTSNTTTAGENPNSAAKRPPEWMLLFVVGSINFISIFLGIFLFVLATSNQFLILDYQDIPLSVSSLQLFVIFYYVYFNEEVFLPARSSRKNNLNEQLAEDILKLMHHSKPYLDAELTLAGFAEMMNTKPHAISKTINDCFNKNFRDFINEFRVKEFIQKMESGDAKSRTFLYLALEVGFNSKSTFNLAFKKATGLSPREYFNQKN